MRLNEDVPESLSESQERYRTLFELAPIGVYSCDASGVVREYNNRAAELWGRKPAPGDTDERFCGSFKMYRPDGRFMPHEQCPMGDVLSGRIPSMHDGEVHIERPDGSRVIAIVNIAPLTDSGGNILGAINCFYDVTERKQIERALRASEKRYRQLYESMDEGFCVIQLMFDANKTAVDYRVLEVNPAFEQQTGIRQATGKTMRQMASHHEAHLLELYGTIALTGDSQRFEYPAGDRWYEGKAYRVGEPLERKVGILFTDITARKRIEAQLREINEELEARVTERTEELTQSQTRLRALAADLNVTAQRERMRLAADLHDDLSQLLAISRIKLDQAKQHPLPPPVEKLIADLQEATNKSLTYTRTLVSQLSPPLLSEFGLPMAMHWLSEQLLGHDLSVVVQVKTTIPTLPEDPALLLFQSTRELLHNCLKHAGTRQATVTLEQVEESLFISVSDQGVGFDPASVTKAPGVGLLSIRERMLSLGGRFELESSLGKGTTATLVLPLSPRTRKSSPTSGHGSIREDINGQADNRITAEEELHSAVSSKVRVLVVDDHAMIRQGFCSVLREYSDIQVVGEAANGEEAIALTDSLRPEVILMDVTMPKMDGVEATRIIMQKYPDMAVISLSIHTSEQIKAAMREAGAVGLIHKEAAVEKLYRTIQTARRSTADRA